jgi:hypothetical protein
MKTFCGAFIMVGTMAEILCGMFLMATASTVWNGILLAYFGFGILTLALFLVVGQLMELIRDGRDSPDAPVIGKREPRF